MNETRIEPGASRGLHAGPPLPARLVRRLPARDCRHSRHRLFLCESLRTRATTGALVSRTLESLQQGQALRSTLKDAETRGAAFC